MKIFITVAFLICTLYANLTTINRNITNTSHKIHTTHNKYQSIYAKMRQNAQDIFEQTKIIAKQQQKLQILSSELQSKEQAYQQNKQKLQQLSATQTTLQNNQKKIEQKLIFTIAKIASLSTIVETKSEQNAHSLMSQEVIKIMIKLTKQEVKSLNDQFFTNSRFIASVKQNISILQTDISTIDAKKKDLSKTKHEHELSLAQLQKDKSKYKSALEKLLQQQHALQATLSHLKIIKINTLQEAQRQQHEKEMLNQTGKTKLLNVKKVGSSYKRVKTIRYRGRKTIPPLRDFTVSKKYGPYTDPVYKIKIFNESVSLQSKVQNAKVRTVFNGKIIFAKKTPLLQKVVIMENKNGMHTIYANLSQIAPDVRVGKKLKKSAVIGRINHQLVFEVTQKTYHINPLELFRH
jgi:murein DD-endopeptidase MepM/ murein hydrolase activator NlpD